MFVVLGRFLLLQMEGKEILTNGDCNFISSRSRSTLLLDPSFFCEHGTPGKALSVRWFMVIEAERMKIWIHDAVVMIACVLE